GAVVTEKDIPEDLIDKVREWRHKLLEGAAELDDHLTEKYLTDENSITPAEIRAALRKGTIERRCYPVLCGAALRNIGIQKLLDAVIEFLPAPHEVAQVEGVNPRNPEEKMTRPHDEDAPFSALVFKVVSDQHGDLTYIRIYSG